MKFDQTTFYTCMREIHPGILKAEIHDPFKTTVVTDERKKDRVNTKKGRV